MKLFKRNLLDFFVVYERPIDYPEHFVIRRFEVTRDGEGLATGDVACATTLAGVREAIPSSKYERFDRAADDEPHIVEVWF